MEVFKNTYFNSFLLVFCLTLFVNCNFDRQILESNFDNNDFNNLATGNTNSDNNVSDFSWDKVKWIADEHNVSHWRETSQITSVKVTQTGAICVDHTKKSTWPDGNEVARSTRQPLVTNFWVIVKLNGQYHAATWEFGVRGQTCKLEHYDSNETLNDLYEHVLREHFKSGPLKSWQPRGGDVVGFMVSGLARHLHLHSIQERSNIQWYRLPSVDGSISGQMLHSTSGSDNNGGDNNDGICSSDQKEPHFKVVGQQCLPSCGHANNLYCKDETQSGRQCGQLARGSRCSDTEDFEIHILETYEQNACCNRKLKPGRANNVCHPDQNEPHYRVIRQQCLPSCGHAANMAGYGGRGPDGQRRTSDDPHTYTKKANSCEELGRLGHLGHSDWKNFSWIDKHTSKTMNNSQIKEVVQNGGVCCVRGNPTNPPVTTTTTTQTTSTTSTSSTTQNFTSPKQIPYLHDVVRRLSQQHPEALRNLGGNPFSWGDYVYNQQKNVQSMEFLDRVIQKLHSIDPRFGYIRKISGRRGEFFGPDDIAYYEGVGNPQGKNMNEGTVFVDHITVGGNPNTIHGWIKVTDYPENLRPLAQWIYPRPGGPNYGYDPNHPGTVVGN